jgi:hypothetical protein
MAEQKAFTAEKLVIGVLSGDPENEDRLAAALKERFGPIDFKSPRIDFGFTPYYNDEMGTPIARFFLSFEWLVPPDTLAAIKGATNRIETEFAVAGKRRFNLDPGILSLSRFILASAKDSSHRIPLREGIYAEVELMFEHKGFRPVEWTYSDYRSRAYLDILDHIREAYRLQVKAAGW